MTPRLVAVRHGETDWNAAARLQGQTDIPLNARGRDQAAAVGRTLKAALPDFADRAFVSSPLSRATETMRLMREAMGLDPDGFTLEPRLKEQTFGLWEGSTFAEIRAREPAALAAREADRWDHRPPQGESSADLEGRVAAALADLPEFAIVVSHGGVMRAMLAHLGAGDRATLPTLRIPQGRALVLETSGWRWI